MKNEELGTGAFNQERISPAITLTSNPYLLRPEIFLDS